MLVCSQAILVSLRTKLETHTYKLSYRKSCRREGEVERANKLLYWGRTRKRNDYLLCVALYDSYNKQTIRESDNDNLLPIVRKTQLHLQYGIYANRYRLRYYCRLRTIAYSGGG
jgi:hypothetical protein